MITKNNFLINFKKFEIYKYQDVEEEKLIVISISDSFEFEKIKAKYSQLNTEIPEDIDFKGFRVLTVFDKNKNEMYVVDPEGVSYLFKANRIRSTVFIKQ